MIQRSSWESGFIFHFQMGFVHLSATDAMNHLPGARVSSAIAEKNSEVIHAIAHF